MRHVFQLISLLVLLFPYPSVCDDPPLKLTAEEQAVVDLTNAERKKAELEPLKSNAKLMKAAREHAANMAKQDKLEHDLDDKSMTDRAKAVEYQFGKLGENIAWNQPTPRKVVAGWMESEDHKMNILTAEFEDIGIGMAKNAKGELYWVQVFGQMLGK